MDKVLEIQFSGWTATPRLPFVLSGNALCMPVPPYSTILGIIGCCLGRFVSPGEVKVGFRYLYDTVSLDIETRRRLQFDGKKIKNHDKGSDAYIREFHTNPCLTIWIDRLDWISFFESPVGTPALGRSQDLLQVKKVCIKEVVQISEGCVKGCMIPFDMSETVPGQLVQLAESYAEGEKVGNGRVPVNPMMFVAIRGEGEGVYVRNSNLYRIQDERPVDFYMHTFTI